MHSWTQTITHLSDLSRRQRQSLSSTKRLERLISVLTILGLEIILLLLSSPLYPFISTITSRQPEQTTYALRRTVTLAILLCALVLVLGITALNYWLQHTWEQNTPSTAVLSETNEMPFELEEALNAPVSASMAPPTIDTQTQQGGKRLLLSGEGRVNQYIVLTLFHEAEYTPQYLWTKADETGNWAVLHENKNHFFPTGQYELYARSYDTVKQQQSPPSDIASGTIVISPVDTVLFFAQNTFVICGIFIFLSAVLISLIIV